MDAIKSYWDEQAHKEHGTNPDVYGHELEIKTILKWIGRYHEVKTILDVGCGTGQTVRAIAAKWPEKEVVGIDYSEEMIHEAISQLTRATYQVADVSNTQSMLPFRDKFDLIISQRCLINLVDWFSQMTGLRNIEMALKPGGICLLMENTMEGLFKINMLRDTVGLPGLSQRWHNQPFFEHDLKKFLEPLFETVAVDCFESTYILASRVFNAVQAQSEDEEPNYYSPINKAGAKLPAIGDYGLTKLWVLKKREV